MASVIDPDAHSSTSTIYNLLANVNEIRLLHLQPGGSDDRIFCRLEHVHFTDKPQYEALSYMWGSKDCPLQIEVNGTMIDIRNNLWQALYHLRKANSIRVLWIDALCIHQDDINERNHQVAQMGRIYENAICVVAWLGLYDDSSRVGMESIQCFNPETAPTLVFDPQTVESIVSRCNREHWTRLWSVDHPGAGSSCTSHSSVRGLVLHVVSFLPVPRICNFKRDTPVQWFRVGKYGSRLRSGFTSQLVENTKLGPDTGTSRKSEISSIRISAAFD